MGRRLWTDGEVHLLLDFLGQDVQAYTAGVKERFYARAKEYLEASGYTKSASQIRTKLGELESSYKSYKLKMTRSGFGVKASDPPSIKALLEKKCPYFYAVDEVFGSRHNVTPPVVLEPGCSPAPVVTTATTTPATDEATAPGKEQQKTQPDTGSETEMPSGETVAVPAPQMVATQSDGNVAKLRQTPPQSATKRLFSTVHPSNLHDALLQIHHENAERKEKPYKREVELQEEQLELAKQQLLVQQEELRLREKKMDQQFTLLCKQLELERERLDKLGK